MADLDLQTVLNSGNLTSAFFGGTTSDDKLLTSSEIDAKDTAINTALTASIDALDTRLTAEENKVNSAISIITPSPLSAQTLVAGTPTKLAWMTSAVVDAGADITYDIPTNVITIAADGIYRVSGVVTCDIPINDIVSIELYKDNLPTGFHVSSIGRGSGSNVSFVYTFMNSFLTNDEITLYVTSSGTTVTVHTASVTVEKTPY